MPWDTAQPSAMVYNVAWAVDQEVDRVEKNGQLSGDLELARFLVAGLLLAFVPSPDPLTRNKRF